MRSTPSCTTPTRRSSSTCATGASIGLSGPPAWRSPPLSCGTNRLCWAIVTAPDGSSAPQLTTIDNGVPQTPGPLDVPGVSLACRSFTCAVVGDDHITIFVSGKQTAVQTVPTASFLSAAAAGPRGMFATVGSAKPNGSVLAISH